MGKETDMKKRIFAPVAAAVALVAALALSACGASPAASDQGSAGSSSADASGEITTLTVGFDQAYPPYGYVGDDGEFTGLDLELAAEVAKRNDWELKLEPIDWDAKDTLMNSGAINCIWNGFTIEGREDGYAFTDPYMENRQVVVVPASSDVQQLSDLAGKNVITQADSAALDVLSEGGSQEELGKSFGNLQTIDNYNTAFMMLESGQVDAIAIDYPVAIFNIGDKTSEFRILDENLNSEHFGVGFAKTDDGAQLAKTVEADLQALDSEGTVKELCEKYADQGVSYDLWCLPKA